MCAGVTQVPCGVAVSGADDVGGRIYVADYNHRRIVRLTRNGRYDGCLVSAGASSAQLVQPQALDIAIDGRLVVVDRTHVKVFDVGIRRRTEVSGTEAPVATEPAQTTFSEDRMTFVRPEAEKQATPPTTVKSASRAKKVGPKPNVPPRPPYLKDLTFAPRTGDQTQTTKTARSVTSASSSLSSQSVTSTSTTTPVPTVSRIPRTVRRASTPSLTSQTSSTKSYIETEVW